MKPYILGLLAALVVLCSVAAGQKTPKVEQLGSELGSAPVEAKGWQNPFAARPEAILAGKKLFGRHCASCHGPEGQGREKAPDLRLPVIQNVPPGVLFWFLKNGNLREGMPSWSRLPDAQRWQLVSYLKTLGPGEMPAEKRRADSPSRDPNATPRP